MLELYDRLPKMTLVDSNGEVLDKPYENMLQTLNAHFVRKTNIRLEVYRLRKLCQEQHETVDMFVLRLRGQAQKCLFDEPRVEEEILQMLVTGTNNAVLRDRILADEKMSLEKAVETGRILEASKANTVEFQVAQTNVFRVSGTKRPNNENRKCFNCGYKGHLAASDVCPAKKEKCKFCHKVGHFQSCCSVRYKKRKFEQTSSGRTVASQSNEGGRALRIQEGSSSEDEISHCFMVGAQLNENKLYFKIGQVDASLFVDSGAEVSLIRSSTWQRLIRSNFKTIEVDWSDIKRISGKFSIKYLFWLGKQLFEF